MKEKIWILTAALALAIPLSLAAQEKKSDTLVVTALLAEIPGKFTANDLYNYVYVMKYRVLKVEKGSYAEKDLLVGHYNPLIPRSKIKDKMDPLVNGTVDKFRVGAKHRLKLVCPIETVWDDAIDDEYIDAETEKYFALQADVIK